MKLVLVALGRRAAFEIADIGALLGDDQRALELTGVLLVDAEIGRELHRAAHAGRHEDERAVGEDRGIQRRVEIVCRRDHRAQIFPHELGMVLHGLREGTKDHAGLGELGLEGSGDGDGIEDGVHRDTRTLHAGEDLLLDERNAQFGIDLQEFGIDLVQRLGARRRLRRGEIIEILEVDFGIVDARPARRLHGQPAAISVKTPFEQPFRLVLFGRDEADNILAEALGGLVGLDIRHEAVFIGLDLDRTDAVDGLLDSRHK